MPKQSNIIEPHIIQDGIKATELATFCGSVVWHKCLLPELEKILDRCIEAAIDPAASPQSRSEHIQAIAVVREIIEMPRAILRKLNSAMEGGFQ